MRHELSGLMLLAVLLAGCSFNPYYRAHFGTGLPEYTGTDIDGKPVSTADFKGKIVVVGTEMLGDHSGIIKFMAQLHGDSGRVAFLAAAEPANSTSSARPVLLNLRTTLGLQNWTLIADDDYQFLHALSADDVNVVLLYDLHGKLGVEASGLQYFGCTQTQLDLLVQDKNPQTQEC